MGSNVVGTENLAVVAQEFIRTSGVTITEIAAELGYSRSVLSRYLAGTYISKSSEVEDKLRAYLEERLEGKLTAFAPPARTVRKMEFFESRDAANILGVCSSCQEFMGLGIVVGKSGLGKTFALRHYAKLQRVAYVECDDTMGQRDLVEAIERALGLPSAVYGTVWRRVNEIKNFFNTNKGYLLIIDEADKLVSKYTQKKMEILRAIFDQSDVGMIIAGEPKLESQIKTYLARFANRVDFYASLRGLSEGEVTEYLGHYDIEQEALTELVGRACNSKNGCFRLLDRTLKNLIRIMDTRGQEKITAKTIAEASAMMML